MSESFTDPADYYDQFSRHYDDRRHSGYHALVDELEASFVPSHVTGTCLEAGCGTGLILSRLAPKFARCVGLDLSEGMLLRASRRGHRVVRGSVLQVPFADASFDTVCSFKVLPHVADIGQALGELARVVRPGGHLVLEFYNRKSLRGLRWRVKLWWGGERIGHGTAETSLFTRYDDLPSTVSFLPPGSSLVGVRGSVIFTPAAGVLKVPVLGTLLQWLERRSASGYLAKYAGFLTLIVRKNGDDAGSATRAVG